MISALIPTYNRGQLAERAVESALAQSLPPAQIIVVDDGSRDDTRERIARFGNKVHYVYQDNAGSAAARTTGLLAAESDWVALLDSDDMWDPQHLERMSRAIDETGGTANYYFADTLEPDEKGNGLLWEKLGFNFSGPHKLASDGTAWVMMRPRQPMMLQSTVVNRAKALEVGGFKKELRYRDDTHLFMKLGLGQPICAVKGCGVIMSSDDLPENRLTLTHDNTAVGTTMRVIMLTDLLESSVPISNETRTVLQTWLGVSHRRLARYAWDDHRYSEFLKELVTSVSVDSQGSWQQVSARLFKR